MTNQCGQSGTHENFCDALTPPMNSFLYARFVSVRQGRCCDARLVKCSWLDICGEVVVITQGLVVIFGAVDFVGVLWLSLLREYSAYHCYVNPVAHC